MNQVELCPDVQSPELSVPCPSLPRGAAPTLDALPWTGALLFLLVGIAIGAIVCGLVLLYYRKRNAEVIDR